MTRLNDNRPIRPCKGCQRPIRWKACREDGRSVGLDSLGRLCFDCEADRAAAKKEKKA